MTDSRNREFRSSLGRQRVPKVFRFHLSNAYLILSGVLSKFNTSWKRLCILTQAFAARRAAKRARGPRDFLALRDRARRSASKNLHSLFDLVCFVHDLVNRNINVLMKSIWIFCIFYGEDQHLLDHSQFS